MGMSKSPRQQQLCRHTFQHHDVVCWHKTVRSPNHFRICELRLALIPDLPLPELPLPPPAPAFSSAVRMAKTLFCVLILLLLFSVLSPSSAEIKSLTINSDTRPMILFEKFGFTHKGHVSIAVSSVSVAALSSASQPQSSNLGFFLLNEESLVQVLIEIQQNPSFCVLDSHYISRLFTFRDLSPPPLASFNRSYPVTTPNEYSLFFANCAPETAVSMVVRTEVYNLDADGSKDYLSAGQTQLPVLYFLFSLAYFAFLGFWVYISYTNKRSVHRIHLLMAGLLLVKALNLIFAAEDKHYVKTTGTPHGWDVLFYIFQFIRVVLLFTVIILIGTGWSFLKPFLQEREKKVLMIVIPLQVLANVASVVIGETGPFIKDWVTWNQVFLLVDIICCCAIIFPIVWSIRSLRETSKTDGKAARNLAKLTLFRQFYIVVIGYLYFTRIVVFALRTIAAYKYQWVSQAAEEIASLAFYMVMFYMFRPVEKNEYFVLDEEEEEAAEMALKDEEFEL
ncbi:protein CANDIDATE G-PROTEIN COUPLED RECEPTOR 7-like [Prosopis cineraria]|uniref:protein CANDIDATE G-PROTEIN COUPLED RECEPTOR 7-like n=1 Tax=Prosopis cineraria TaxID=364024 RepID=UPI00241086EB|nr:protein CANDIDATE G-PROTEIN COUPLED RECEPTOR 7-like [Prosopis cineraria]